MKATQMMTKNPIRQYRKRVARSLTKISRMPHQHRAKVRTKRRTPIKVQNCTLILKAMPMLVLRLTLQLCRVTNLTPQNCRARIRRSHDSTASTDQCRAERRCGEMLAAMPKNKGVRVSGQKDGIPRRSHDVTAEKLADGRECFLHCASPLRNNHAYFLS